MNLHLAALPRLKPERRISVMLGMIIIAVLWLGIGLKYLEDASSDLREAERANKNFAMVFEESVLRSVGEVDKALLYLRHSVETRMETSNFDTIVDTTDVLCEIIIQVSVVDAKGTILASNARPKPQGDLNISDREHFRVHLSNPGDELFISEPVIGRASGQWSVQFTRRFLNSDQTFGGVVVASLKPEHFTKFYERIDFGSAASISLIGSDGIVRSSGDNAGGFALGQDITGTRLFTEMRDGINKTFVAADLSGLGSRLVTMRKVTGLPLWVSVSTSVGEIYRGSWSTLKLNALAGVLLTLILLLTRAACRT
jgi:hypothetical protein